MGQISRQINRGTASSIQWAALCKDCRRNFKNKASPNFTYPDAWIETVVEKGGTRSDRCPVCRREHSKDAKTFAAPYVDLDVIGRVTDPLSPNGPLGGLGPLPIEHERTEIESNLNEYDFGLRDEDITKLLAGLVGKRVAVVTAGTGTGKSTFLPYRLLIPPENSPLKIADNGPIVVTEPRRAAAIDTATFVATKLHKSHVGAGSDVGYRVQNEPAYDGSCRLLYVTDGSLINWLRDGSFKRFGAIIVDEAHERSKNIDLILGFLRDALPKAPHLKIIIASATIDPKFFIDYFGGTEQVYYLDAPAQKTWGYGMPLWPGEIIDLEHPDWQKKGPNGEDLQAITEQLLKLRILDEPIDPGNHASSWRDKMPRLVAEQVLALLKGTQQGDILAFLPGKDAIETAIELIKKKASRNVDIYPLLRNSPPQIQLAARGEKNDKARRRVVVSTNIAETSLTIDGITYVVDSGLIRQTQWNSETASKFIPVVVHSRDGVKQRWGRVGRKSPGWVFPLYSKDQYETESIFPAHTPPESVRDDLEQFFLTAKSAGIDTPKDFLWPAAFIRAEESPSPEQIGFSRELTRSESALKLSGLIDGDGDVTPLGKEVQVFNTSIFQARAMVFGDNLACATEVATALALLNGPKLIGNLLEFDPKWDVLRRNYVRRIHEATLAGCVDDLDIVLTVFALWERSSDREEWAKSHFIDQSILKKASETRRLLLEPLSPARKSDVIRTVAIELAQRVRFVFSRTLIDQTFNLTTNGWTPMISKDSKSSWLLDPLARYSGSESIVAFRRASSRAGVWLSNIVNAISLPSEHELDWLSLSLRLSEQSRDPQGNLMAATIDSHKEILDKWQIGGRYRSKIRKYSDRIMLTNVSLMPTSTLSTTNQIPILTANPSLVEDEEESLEEQEVDAYNIKDGLSELESDIPEPDLPTMNEDREEGFFSEKTKPEEETLEFQEESAMVDFAALSETGVLDESQEPEFINIADLETDEWFSPVKNANRENNYLDSQSTGPLSVTSVPDVEWLDNSIGVHILGVSKVDGNFVVIADSIQNEKAYRKLEPLRRLQVTVIEKVKNWGDSFLVGLDRESSVEIIVPASELSFNYNANVIDAIPLGAIIEVTLLQSDNDTFSILASCLDYMYYDLISRSIIGAYNKKLYEGEIKSIDQKGHGEVVLKNDQTKNVFHSYFVRRSLLNKSKIKPEIGQSIWIELELPVSQFADGLARMPVPKALRSLSQKTQTPLMWAKKNKSVACELMMSPETRDNLIRISTSPLWAKLVYELWFKSNQLEVVALQPTDESVNLAVQSLREKFPKGSMLRGKINNIKNNLGVFVSLSDQINGLLFNSNIGAEGVIRPDRFFKIGQEVDVRILDHVKIDEKGKPRINLGMDGPFLNLRDQIIEIYPIGQEFDAIIKNIDKSKGMYFYLNDGLLAFVPNKEVGPDGVLDSNTYFKEGESWKIMIKNILVEKNRQVTIHASMNNFQLPSMLDQLRSKFAKSMQVKTRVSKVDDNKGVFLITEDGFFGLAPKHHIGSEGVILPSKYIKVGQEFNSEIEDVKVNKDSEPRLAFRINTVLIPSRLDQLIAIYSAENILHQAIVDGFQKDHGVFIKFVDTGESAIVYKKSIGPSGVSNPSSVLKIGERIAARVVTVQVLKNGKVGMVAIIPELPK